MFDRFYAKKWRFFLQIFREKLAFFGVNFILQKFCQCKKNDKYQVCNSYVQIQERLRIIPQFYVYLFGCRTVRLVLGPLKLPIVTLKVLQYVYFSFLRNGRRVSPILPYKILHHHILNTNFREINFY